MKSGRHPFGYQPGKFFHNSIGWLYALIRKVFGASL